jgi:ABC-type multidrug transport system ATPase subunit
VGVNGAGKSTFLRLLLGLHPARAGTAKLSGLGVDQAAARRAVAYLPERFLPPQALTGREFLDLAARLYGDSAAAAAGEARPEAGPAESRPADARADTRAAEARTLEALDFDPSRLALRVGALSKGTAQKLGLAAVVLSRRPLWVLDEPFSGLDPLAREGLLALLRAHRSAGGSILYTTHALADVPRLADRLVVLHGGVARFDGSPATLMAATGEDTLEAAWVACVRATRTHVAPA